ncbi:MAG: sigma-70 family RNA polymerase sigma factor [Verrucomicrobiales bacterium]|nr:sigma-70 family RNA polymerase sigma factor [Verrucomicrobiales bacterium]
MPSEANLISPNHKAVFATTRWKMVLAARADSPVRGDALEQLCSTYWLPVYGYLRRHGHGPHESEDLTQSFFASLLETDFLDRADPARGRFRSFLIGALRHFLSSHFERVNALKRGGGAQFVDWSTFDAEKECARAFPAQADPAQAYEVAWAYALMNRALARLEEEYAAAGRGPQFSTLKPFLGRTPTRGDYVRVAEILGTTRTTVAVWAHRLGQRYAELVKLEVAATVGSADEVNDELRHLVAMLRH